VAYLPERVAMRNPPAALDTEATAFILRDGTPAVDCEDELSG